jgi:hypothetical protein
MGGQIYIVVTYTTGSKTYEGRLAGASHERLYPMEFIFA